MTALLRTATLLVTTVLLSASVRATMQEPGRLTGRVTDESGGALPGVTVTVTSPERETSINRVTDGIGRYSLPLPSGTYIVSFDLPGFLPQTRTDIVVEPSHDVAVDGQLQLAPLSETVTVTAPPPPAPPPPPMPPFVRPRPATIPVPPEVLASVCGPSQPADGALVLGHIARHRHDPHRQLYGRGDTLVLDIGQEQDVAVGQNFVVRRRFRTGDKSLPLALATFGEHTAGLIQVVEAGERESLAVVVYACDELIAGDGLEAFDASPRVTADVAGTPQFDEPAHIVFGDDGRTLAAPPQLMVIDRGAEQGVVRGQRLTIFRRPDGDHRIARVGEGIVVAVRPNGATIRLERSTDAVSVGDLVALHR